MWSEILDLYCASIIIDSSMPNACVYVCVCLLRHGSPDNICIFVSEMLDDFIQIVLICLPLGSVNSQVISQLWFRSCMSASQVRSHYTKQWWPTQLAYEYFHRQISLTHLSLDKMTVISQTTFSDTFSWMNIFVFCSKFHWSLFLKFQLTKN